MTTAIIILIFAAAGIFIFSFVAGAAVFAQMFARKEDDGSLNPQVIASSLEQMRQNKSGMELEGVRMPGGAKHLSSHINDTRIMIPLLEAKLRWFAMLEQNSPDSIERLSIRGTYRKQLAGYYLKPKNLSAEHCASDLNCVALLVHGYTDSAAGMAYLAEEYTSRGIAVVAVDCRAHGHSDGNVITLGYTDSKDIVLWVEEIKRRFGDVKIILHGVSMGAATVILSLARRRMQSYAGQIVLAVADCGFSCAKAQMLGQSRVLFGSSGFQQVLARLVLSGMSLVNFFMCGFFIGQNSPLKALRKKSRLRTASVPVILFHGEKDAFVPIEMSDALKEAGGDNTTLIKVKDAPHIGSYFYAPEMYMSRIMDALASRNVSV